MRKRYSLAVTLVMVFLMIGMAPKFANAGCASPPSGLVSWWGGDNNALDIIGTNNGILNGATYAPGKVGQAFSFSGGGAGVSVPASSNWAFGTGDFAIAFWAYSATNDDHRPLINNRSSSASNHMWAVEVYPVANRVEFHSGLTVFLTATNLLTSSSWNHVVVTRNSGTLSIYINGVLSGSVANTSDFSEINELEIGRDIMSGNDLAGKSFQGLIDEVQIFKHALSASEIAAIYNAGNDGMCRPSVAPLAGLISWWKGENNATDQLGVNNATLQGGATFAAGKVGQAFSLNGTDAYVQAAAGITAASQFSFSFWMNITSFSHHGYMAPFCQSSDFNNTFCFFTGDNSDSCGFQGEWQDGTYFDLRKNISFGTGVWKHIAVTYDGSTLKQYVDGILDNQNSYVGKTLGNNQPFIIGKGFAYPGSVLTTTYFSGLIDEVSIFNKALTADEIAAIYNAGGSGMTPIDITPDAFDFTAQTGMPTNTTIVSNPITVTGINYPTAISITGGDYQINGGSWTSSSGTVSNGDTVTVRQTSSASPSTPTTATLTIGGVNGAFNVTTAASADPDASGLVAWWRAENNAYDSVGGNNGTLMHGTTYAAGQIGQAFSLSSATNDGIIVPGSAEQMNPTEAISMSAWIEPTALSNPWPYIIGKVIYLGPIQYSITISDRNTFTCDISSAGVAAEGGYIPLNQWSHVVCTYDRSTLRLYVNGEQVASAPGTAAIATGSQPVSIGMLNGYTNRNFDGLIDEVKIFNRALSVKEVQKLANPNGPVSWWRGENDATDSIGNNDGTWQGAPAYGLGMSGNALVFDGVDNYIQITPQSGSLDISTGHSFNLWIKLDGYPTTAAYILNKWVSGVEDKLLVVLPDGSVAYYLNNAFGGSGVISSTKLELGRWYHLGATYDGSNARLYINGSLDATKGAPGAVNNGNGTLYLGFNPVRNAVEPHDHLKGTVDEIKWYNRALSAIEIANSYGIVSWWKADNDALDSAGANNGVWNGTPSYSPGVAGEAFSLDGSGKSVTVPANSAWAFGTGDFAVSFWAYSATFSDHLPFINNRKTSASDSMWAIETYPLANRVEFHSGLTIFLTATNLLNSSNWNHIAVTRSGSTLSMYINGVPSGSASISANFSEINDLQIGRDVMSGNDLAGKSFQGLIDDVKMFNRSLSAAEVSQQAGTLPDPFAFTPVTGAARSTLVESESITVSGISQPAAISMTGGEYQLNGGAWTSSSGTVNLGAKVKVRLTTSASFAMPTTATLTIGGVNGSFSVTTLADTLKPVVSEFTLTETESTSMTVGVASFIATDNDTVSGYMITTSSTPPSAADADWSGSAPATVTLALAGTNTLYAWAKDPAGNVSDPRTATLLFKPVRRGTSSYSYYEALSTACADADSGETICALAVTVPGSVTLSGGKALVLEGGFADGYGSQDGFTTLQGTLTVGSGSLTVERVVVR